MYAQLNWKFGLPVRIVDYHVTFAQVSVDSAISSCESTPVIGQPYLLMFSKVQFDCMFLKYDILANSQ